MSAALINRSLTTVKTELEFLKDSNVITDALYDRLVSSIPTKYDQNGSAWDVDRLGNNSASDQLSSDLSKVTIHAPEEEASPPPRPAPKLDPKPLGYCRSLYDYQAQEDDDLSLRKDDKIAVLEHLSEDWWKGYHINQGPQDAGVFPSNYVTVISQQEFDLQRSSAPLPEKKSNENEKATYNNDSYAPAPPQYSPNQYMSPQQMQPPLQQQPSYGGYAQYPPPSANYYPPPMQQQVPQEQPVQQQGGSHPHMKKFGSKLGNAAIFGAGATIGSDIVNSIF